MGDSTSGATPSDQSFFRVKSFTGLPPSLPTDFDDFMLSVEAVAAMKGKEYADVFQHEHIVAKASLKPTANTGVYYFLRKLQSGMVVRLLLNCAIPMLTVVRNVPPNSLANFLLCNMSRSSSSGNTLPALFRPLTRPS